jgi:uncharacterized membrane protein YfcA
MFQTFLPFVALFLTGLVAGTLNTLAGGGSLISLPVMIFLGLPATVANGTLRLGILIQNVGSVWGFGRQGVFEPTLVKRYLPPALLGVVAGTALGVRMGDLAFQRTLAVVMVLVALWIVWRPPGGAAPSTDGASPRRGPPPVLLYGGFFLVGAYGGFIQAGVGFLILALTSAAGLDLVKGNAMKVLLSGDRQFSRRVDGRPSRRSPWARLDTTRGDPGGRDLRAEALARLLSPRPDTRTGGSPAQAPPSRRTAPETGTQNS